MSESENHRWVKNNLLSLSLPVLLKLSVFFEHDSEPTRQCQFKKKQRCSETLHACNIIVGELLTNTFYAKISLAEAGLHGVDVK